MNSNRVAILTVAIFALVAPLLAISVPFEAIKSDKLMKLIDGVRQRQKPTVDSVIEAFNQYVVLYQEQSELSRMFQPEMPLEKVLGKSETERKYKQLSELLDMPELKIVSRNLFSAVAEDVTSAYTNLVVDADGRKRIERAIEALGL